MAAREWWKSVSIRLANLVMLMCSAGTEAAVRADVLVLTNGDRITGEIVELKHGKLKVKTDYMGTLSIEWAAVARLSSKQTFDVEAVTGEHHFGDITTSPDGRWLVVGQPSSAAELPHATISRIAAVEQKFLERINGSLSFGYNFSESSEITVLSGRFDATYRAALTVMNLRMDGNSTTSPAEGTLDRNRISLTYQWLRPNARFWAAVASFEQNEELGVDGRLQTGAAYGRYLFQSATAEVAGLAGVVVNQEWVTGDAPDQQNVEALLAGTWHVFRFTAPETSLALSTALFPSLSQSGRYRAGMDASLRHEIIDDFFIDLSAYYDYDSEPPSDFSAKDDYGITTSLGYSF